MIPLYEALDCVCDKNRPGLIKHLKLAKIDGWDDIDRWHISRFASEVKSSMAPSSCHTTFAVFKAFLAKFEDDVKLPKDWRKMLETKNEQPMKTYLTAEEVEAFGEAYVDSDSERTVRDGFYVSCKTGLRHSDLVKLLPSNFQPREGGGYNLNYVSKKTRVQSTVICSEATKEKVEWLHKHGTEVSLTYYNKLVRVLAERADINTVVSVYKAGKEMTGPKYMFLSSHSARVSFCTILADFGTDILDIARLAGHTNTNVTMRYIVNRKVNLSPNAMKFLM